jgi:RecA-family ATPase
MDRILRGKGRAHSDLEGYLFVNSREQSADFRVDKSDLLGSMIAGLKSIKPEFVILDVFNVMHGAEENDNTQMRAVVEQLSVLQREVSCSIGVVHHFNKQSEGSLTQRLRGASAIAGWAEWLIGIEAVDSNIRRMSFELKASADTKPLTYEVRSFEVDQSIRIERSEWNPEPTPRRGRRAEEVLL